MYNSRRQKLIKMVQYECANLPILHMADSKRLTSTTTTVQRTLPSCIALCSVDLIDSVAELGLVLDFNDYAG